MACVELLESPRISFSRDFSELDLGEGRKRGEKEGLRAAGDEDFEFCVKDNVSLMPAEELIFQGKILPFQGKMAPFEGKGSIGAENSNGMKFNGSSEDLNSPSPKAPKCSWKELLGLKKTHTRKSPATLRAAKKLNWSADPKGFEPMTSSLSQPLLPSRDSDAESVSARFSLSDLEELPRYSVDSINEDSVLHKPLRALRVARPLDGKTQKTLNTQKTQVRNPRGLERSCSSPSSFRKRENLYKNSTKALERSYSANVRVAPVLNVPVVCIRGAKGGSKGGNGGGKSFGLTNLFNPHQKKNSKETRKQSFSNQ